jgi:hypothetical protein
LGGGVAWPILAVHRRSCPAPQSDIRQTRHFASITPYSGAFGAMVSSFPTTDNGVNRMDLHIRLIMLQPIVALIAGILILLMPRLLNFIVALYLIIIGITGLFPHLLQ